MSVFRFFLLEIFLAFHWAELSISQGKSSQVYLPASKGYDLVIPKWSCYFLYSYPCAALEPLLWGSELGLIHLKESKHFCIAI